MSRPALFSILLACALAVPASQAQTDLHGVPSTITAPGPDGRPRGIPSTITAPGPDGRPRGVPSTITAPTPSFRRLTTRPPVPFGDPHRRHQIVPVPLFYPVYLYPVNDPAGGQEQQAAPDASSPSDDSALQDAYNQGARDALARQQNQNRNAQRSMERTQFGQPADVKTAAVQPAQFTEPEPDNTPPTVFIFKDGHRLETKSFAIMGQTLFDFSSKPLRKIQLSDLDVAATVKVNDEMGNPLRLQ